MWPSRSPDLTPLFFMGGCVKDQVCSHIVNTVDELEALISAAIMVVTKRLARSGLYVGPSSSKVS